MNNVLFTFFFFLFVVVIIRLEGNKRIESIKRIRHVNLFHEFNKYNLIILLLLLYIQTLVICMKITRLTTFFSNIFIETNPISFLRNEILYFSEFVSFCLTLFITTINRFKINLCNRCYDQIVEYNVIRYRII